MKQKKTEREEVPVIILLAVCVMLAISFTASIDHIISFHGKELSCTEYSQKEVVQFTITCSIPIKEWYSTNEVNVAGTSAEKSDLENSCREKGIGGIPTTTGIITKIQDKCIKWEITRKVKR